jgi:N-methylhydantoinase B
MTNTLNTPVEALEMAYPFRVTEYAVRRGSGGAGKHPGGDGVTRTYEFLTPSTVTLQTERRTLAPYGLNGGKPGTPGRNTLTRAENVEEGPNGAGEAPDPDSPLPPSRVLLPSKTRLTASPGDRLTIETPGGGGWGRARHR